VKTAILVDGDFYLRRHSAYFGKEAAVDPEKVATDFWVHCMKHLDKEKDQLYRIFFYDCPPLEKRVHHPITKRSVNLSESFTAKFRKGFHKAIIKKSHVALRLGYLDEGNGSWRIKNQENNKKVISGDLDPKTLNDEDFAYHANQKGVDMRIGLDIAAITYKKLAERIILIAGDSDFVPAAKLARREGMQFILDSMRNYIREDLQEHIDGLKTTLPRVVKKQVGSKARKAVNR
jgi:uncharacterized LabA/DUF88 family protein